MDFASISSVSKGQGQGLSYYGSLDMAKIGQLYSEPRRWNDNQLVTAEWVDESTAVYNHWDKLLYGYLWWIIDENEHSYAAMGDVGTGFKD